MDEKALEAAWAVYNKTYISNHAQFIETIKAYLAAAPGEYGGLVERLRARAEQYQKDGMPASRHTAAFFMDAATAIATLSAKLAAAEANAQRYDALAGSWRERSNEAVQNAMELREKLAAAEARADKAERLASDAVEQIRLIRASADYHKSQEAMQFHNELLERRINADNEAKNQRIRAEAAEARADAAERERDRLTHINADLCRSHNTLNLDGARLEEKLKAALAREAKLREALTDAHNNGLIYWEPNTERGRVTKMQMLARIDAVLAQAGDRKEGGENV